MNDQTILIIESEVAKGHIVKAALVFLDSFIKEQRDKIIPMLGKCPDYQTDIFIADLSALNRVKKILSHCAEMSERAENEINDDTRMA